MDTIHDTPLVLSHTFDSHLSEWLLLLLLLFLFLLLLLWFAAREEPLLKLRLQRWLEQLGQRLQASTV